MERNKNKIAIVLFNLGGPDRIESVKPFLFNLFNDKAIIRLPGVIRFFLARLISSGREKTAREIYEHMGGKSPLLEITNNQAGELENMLNSGQDTDGIYVYKSFVAMRYWHPFIGETAEKISEYNPEEIILLPLYPHFSTTTTGSALAEWKKQAIRFGLDAIKTRTIHSYPTEEKYIASQFGLISDHYSNIKDRENCRILFSAHGLPKKISELSSEPYVDHIRMSVEAIMNKMAKEFRKDIDYNICFQSRVGPVKWIGPSLDEELKKAAADKKGVLIVPISFVSEHSETLVELDIEYKKPVYSGGVRFYERVNTPCTDKLFIQSLAKMCVDSACKDFEMSYSPGE